MSTLRTVDDLRADALFRAGEPPTDTTGSFWTKSLEYLNRVQQQLLLGGSIAVGRDLATSAGIYAHLVDTPITDWWWARKRGVLNTQAVLQTAVSGTLSPGDSSILLTAPVTRDTREHYVIVDQRPTVYRSLGLSQTSASRLLLDAAYVDDATTGGTVFVAQIEYDLAPDFLRFCSTPYIHSVFGASIDVSSLEQRNSDWPLAIVRQGRPTRAFMVSAQRVAINGFDTRAYRFEYEYVAMPIDLVASGVPVLPEHHRAVLSAGAAMLMCFDKGDGRTANLASEYRELVGRMVQEHRRAIGGGSSTFGQFKVRRPATLRRSPQTFGELFLV